ncbi:hypothetical protein HPB51_000248 [Rhipicephalus microplus]|uniref:Uncharacterized protein n=1 Tax=Rhipicephalus microplus TaxID=6941 RepID=A0A9J6D3I7_RHIMP|nr:hypothetical protein HPB51_000248 [Rhipicephalus microplus]
MCGAHLTGHRSVFTVEKLDIFADTVHTEGADGLADETTSLPDQPPASRDKVRVHPTNNTFTFSVRQSVRAQAYLRIMSLQIGVWTIEFQVYAPPPDDAFWGIMFNAYNGFTNAEVLKDSRKSNPTMHVVVGGRRIRRTNYVVVTLHADCLPRCIFYYGIYVHLYPFYPRV